MKYSKILDLENQIPIFDKDDFPCSTCSYPCDPDKNSCLSCNIFNKHSPQERFFDRIISVGKYFQTKTAENPEIKSEYNLTWLIINYKRNNKYLKYCSNLLSKNILDFIRENNLNLNDILICCVPDLEDKSYQKANSLLESLGNKTNLKILSLLKKERDIPKQHKINKIKDKFNNVLKAYCIKKEYQDLILNKIIFLIDDVVSSTASVNECSKELKNLSAKKVYVFSLGRNILLPSKEKKE